MNDSTDISAALAPLGRDGAPAGFAVRLQARYLAEFAARRQRKAFAVSAGAFAALAAVMAALGSSLSATVAPSGIATTCTVLARAFLHPLVSDLARTATTAVALSLMAAVCFVSLAALVRRETSFAGRAQ